VKQNTVPWSATIPIAARVTLLQKSEDEDSIRRTRNSMESLVRVHAKANMTMADNTIFSPVTT
jgi:hypothetical protein